MELKKASENKTAFRNLFNLYCYELSFDDPWLGTMISSQGFFNPPGGIDNALNDPGSYVIYEDDHAVGFVMFTKGIEADYSVEEIFVTSAYRRKGIASAVVGNYLKDKKGVFMVHILKKSTTGLPFFLDFFAKNRLEYEKKPLDEVADCYYVNL